MKKRTLILAAVLAVGAASAAAQMPMQGQSRPDRGGPPSPSGHQEHSVQQQDSEKGHSGQMMHGGMQMMRGQSGQTATSNFPDTPYGHAASSAMTKMMMNMDMRSTGDADKDFAAMMVPHHQGAIDMARVQLEFGKDPELRALAQSIIDAQLKEIAQMTAWQAKPR